ncbi:MULTISPECIES: sensor domain-containing diguanylate cyclase [Methylomonas]|uniref:GGDEF domain-containing protein n=1 Tax=Methylomonas koyamae TaxID=702114 RepID=A0A177NWW2_9GAMM|nr:sensor domain-containing diguanylate cyclase [Methylomonas koyamae]OAI22421.1 hypothetical protein A1355_02080 [Methylomonas koyamae]
MITFKKLSVRITLVISFFALLVAGVGSAVSYTDTLRQERNKAYARIMELAKTVEKSAQIAAYLDNQEIADDVIGGLMNNEVVAGVLLKSQSGWHSTNDHKPLNDALGEAPLALDLDSPFSPGEKVGVLQIFPKHDIIERNAKLIARNQALLLSSYTLIVALIIMLAIQQIFVRTIKTVASTLNRIDPSGTKRLHCPLSHRKDEIGHLIADINFLLDISHFRIHSERELREQLEKLEQRFRLLFENASVGICVLNEHGDVILHNPVCREVLRLDAAPEGPARVEQFFKDARQINRIVFDTLTAGELTNGEFELATTDDLDGPRWAQCLFSKARVSETSEFEGSAFVQMIVIDITERKIEELQTRFKAERDPLTKLFNRNGLETRLNLMRDLALQEACGFAIFLMDLDNFKPINDNYGHEAGDTVLIAVAERLLACFRANDILVRLGGDEFLAALICKPAINQADLSRIAQKTIRLLLQDIPLNQGRNANIGVSIGICASGPEHAHLSIAQLIDHADKAMYQVKLAGKNDFCISVPSPMRRDQLTS